MAGPAFKRPESVLIVVYSGERVLMLERRSPPGFWQSVTGSLEDGEVPADAAVRELDEETGWAAEGLRDLELVQRFPILPQWSSRFAPGVRENVEHAFALELPGTPAPKLRPGEHVSCRWLTVTEALGLASSWTNRNAIRRIYGLGGQEDGDGLVAAVD